jgi:hypothetical protein
MVGHTLFVTFHDHAEDSDFYQGLRHVVQSIVAESPGAHCTETLLCRSMASAIDAMGRDVESESTSRRIAEDEDLQDDDDGRDDDDDANEYNADLGDGSGGAGAFWVLLDDNLNSLERIKEREQGALKSARGGPPPPDSGHSNRDDAVPMTRSRSAGLSSKKLMRKVSQDILMLDEVAVRLEKALKLIQRGRQLADRDRGAVLEGRGMDALVDALAQA